MLLEEYDPVDTGSSGFNGNRQALSLRSDMTDAGNASGFFGALGCFCSPNLAVQSQNAQLCGPAGWDEWIAASE